MTEAMCTITKWTAFRLYVKSCDSAEGFFHLCWVCILLPCVYFLMFNKAKPVSKAFPHSVHSWALPPGWVLWCTTSHWGFSPVQMSWCLMKHVLWEQTFQSLLTKGVLCAWAPWWGLRPASGWGCVHIPCIFSNVQWNWPGWSLPHDHHTWRGSLQKVFRYKMRHHLCHIQCIGGVFPHPFISHYSFI